ncbi:MAG: GerW family sporulation protein [Tyzzerella sp.]|nr:GerW family sporulation protein [Tyzzerella sp.]
MEENKFNSTVSALFSGMDSFISSKTVVGDAIHVGDTIILPLVDVSFAVGAGAFHADKKERGAGGLGGKISPSAVLVIQNGRTKLVNIKNQDTITKLLDLVPDVIDRVKEKKEDKVTEKDVDEMLDKAENK